MRKIINSTYMTLDGDITNMADWHMDYFGDDALRAANDQLQGADALIMGRATYDGFAPAWSSRSDDDAFAARMNSIRKYVVSSTLTDPTWNNSVVINGNVAAEVRKLKEQPGENILQYGFGDVSRLLLQEGLLDELRVWLHPVISGKAKPSELIYRDTEQARFTLSDTDIHSTGIVILTYTPTKAP